jgi:hypothetical protein
MGNGGIAQKRSRGLWLCILVMGGIHAWVLWLLPAPFEKPAPRVFDVLLTEFVPEQDLHANPERQHEPEPQAQSQPETSPTVSPRQPVAAPLEPDETGSTDFPANSAAVPPVPLQFDRGREWGDLPELRSAVDGLVSAFRPRLLEGLETRRNARARADLLHSRGVAFNGLPIDEYNALEGPVSNHIKTAAGCFNLHNDSGEAIGPTGFEKRWWRTRCKDLRRSPFQMDRLEYDVVGRAIGR